MEAAARPVQARGHRMGRGPQVVFPVVGRRQGRVVAHPDRRVAQDFGKAAARSAVEDARLGHHQQRAPLAHVVEQALKALLGPGLVRVDQQHHVGALEVCGQKVLAADQLAAQALDEIR